MNKSTFVIGAFVIMSASVFLGFKTQQYLHQGENREESTPVRFTSETVLGTQRPAFSLPDLQGTERHVSEWDGKVLAINFWATWCPPCIEEIPEFIKLQTEYGDAGLQFLGIALQDAEEVRGFYEEMGMNYPSLVGQQKVIAIAKRLGNDIGALPYTVIIKPSGQVHYVKRGPLSAEQARKVIESLL